MVGDHAAYSVRDGAGAGKLHRASGAVAVDIETQGLGADQWHMTAVSIGTGVHAHVLDPVLDAAAIRDALDEATTLVFHNSPFDVPVLVNAGLMRLAHVAKVYDTLVTARLASPSEHGGHRLGQACTTVLGDGYDRQKRALEEHWRFVTGKTKAAMFHELGMGDEAFMMYAAFDVVMTARLYGALPAVMVAHTTDHPFPSSGDAATIIEREQTVSRVLLAQTCRGITLDFDVVDEIKAELATSSYEADLLLATYGVNVELGRELVKRDAMRALDAAGELPASYKRLLDGTPSADKRYLARVVHPIVDALEIRSRADRFTTDYGDKLVHLSHGGRIHPQVAVCKALTGRMAYSNPPLQQYPEAVRRMLDFGEPVTSMDWSAIEPVLAANLFGELELLEHFEAGGDIYQPVADAIRVERPVAKVVLLAQIYGQGALGLATRLGRDEDETKLLVARVNDYLGNIAKAVRIIRSAGDRFGKVQTVGGRIVPLEPDPRTGNVRFFGYRGVNYVVQGGAYDLLADVIYRADRAGLGDAIRIAVHDELVVAADAADDIEQLMLTPADFLVEAARRTPVLRVGRAELGTHWEPKEH
jgi:DNA polymerase-1